MDGSLTGAELRQQLRVLSAPRSECCAAAPEEGAVVCVACSHRCLIREGRHGICRVRFCENGRLMVPWGYVAGGLAVDPIEKKPFFHVRPGSGALSFGLLGCDMHCAYCQNWVTSQALRERAAGVRLARIEPEAIRDRAVAAGCASVISTYNEPLITAEWAADVFDACRERKLLTGFVSNGNATPEVLDYLSPRLDLFKVDLKSFDDRSYRRLGAVLDRILDGIRAAYDRGLWLEIVTLVVPGFNDSSAELSAIAEFIASLSPEIPWHVTAFRPEFRMTDRGPTSLHHLLRAIDAGRGAGLRFIYAGNVGGRPEIESTCCPGCGARLIHRAAYRVRVEGLVAGSCEACGTRIPGRW